MPNNVFLWIFVVFGAVLVLHLAIKFWPRSIQGRYDDLWMAFQAKTKGMTPDERFKAQVMLTAAARARRRISEATLKAPAKYREIIDEVSKDEIMMMASSDKQMSRGLAAWLNEAPLDEILYPAALKLVMAELNGTAAHRAPGQDDFAALKILG